MIITFKMEQNQWARESLYSLAIFKNRSNKIANLSCEYMAMKIVKTLHLFSHLFLLNKCQKYKFQDQHCGIASEAIACSDGIPWTLAQVSPLLHFKSSSLTMCLRGPQKMVQVLGALHTYDRTTGCFRSLHWSGSAMDVVII